MSVRPDDVESAGPSDGSTRSEYWQDPTALGRRWRWTTDDGSSLRRLQKTPLWCRAILGTLALAGLCLVIFVLTCIHELGPEQQLLVEDPEGRWIRNGPWRGVVITSRKKTIRAATLLMPEEYAVVKNSLTGQPRNELGPQLFFLGPYDTDVEVRSKILLLKGEYIRLEDRNSGAARVLAGPQAVVPEATETFERGVQQARFLEVETALLVQDVQSGTQRLVSQTGLYVPRPYEEILEERRLVHVLPHEAVVVRDAQGQLTLHNGGWRQDGEGPGTAFFLQPYHRIVEMQWSDYSQPPELQSTAKIPVTKIDMRAKKMFFSYNVRTSDNVKLILGGTIFWKVSSLATMIAMTSDPEGDVWHHARSALIEAVSNATLQTFMSGFNGIVMRAFHRQAEDGFYAARGVEMQSMEVTRFDCADAETARVLQATIQETTNRINRLTSQQSENEVRAAAMNANITLERSRSELVRTQAENMRLESGMTGEAEGTQLVRSANAFIGGLSESVPEVDLRIDLYRMLEHMRGRNADTQNLASGSAHLFLTPQDLNLRLDTPGATTQEL